LWVPVGILGGGVRAGTVDRGIALGADVIAVAPGPQTHSLGTATPKTAWVAAARDLKGLMLAAHSAGIPYCPLLRDVPGWTPASPGSSRSPSRRASCFASPACSVSCRPPRRRSCARPDGSARAGPRAWLDAATLARCSHVAGLMGHEPIAAAVQDGVDVVLAVRATDTALIAAFPLLRGMPAGPVWHGAKIAECGGLCTTNPRSGGALVTFDETGFECPAPGRGHPLRSRQPSQTRPPTPQLQAATPLYPRPCPYRNLSPSASHNNHLPNRTH